MTRAISFPFVLLASLVLASGCGSDERGISFDTTGADTAPADTAAPDGAGSDADVAADTAAPAAPNACEGDGDCSGKACRSGVCVADPPGSAIARITDPQDNISTDTGPDLSCVGMSVPPATQTTTATLYGAVARFGKGKITSNMHVDVLLAEGFDPVECEALTAAAEVKACYREYGTPIGSTTSVAAPTPDSLPPSCDGHEDCPLGYQCTETSSVVDECTESFSLYEISDVPTNTPLIIRTYAPVSGWHDTYVFNVVLPEEQVDADGRVQYDATMVSHGQWLITANTIGLLDIPVDKGAVGGRVRDCEGGSRVSWPISEVSVDLATPARGLAFFNDLEDDAVPLIDRVTTNILGRFAALDIPSGWNVIAGSARVGSEVVTIGALPVYVVPDSLSIVSWPGRIPYWRQN